MGYMGMNPQPLPFYQKPKKAGQEAVAAGPAVAEQAGGADPLTARIDDIVRRLEMPRQEPVERPTVGRRIAAGLSDAMMAYAQALMGQAPTGAGATQRLQDEQEAGKERNRKAAEQSSLLKNQVVLETYRSELQRQEAEGRAATNAAVEQQTDRNKEMVDSRKKAREEWSEMIEDPALVDYWRSKRPAFDPRMASHEDILGLKADFATELLVQQGMEQAAAARMARQAVATQTAMKMFPGLAVDPQQTVSVSAEGKPSVSLTKAQPRAEKQEMPPGRDPANGFPLSYLGTKGKEIGENLIGLPAKVVGEKIAAFGKERKRWVTISDGLADRMAKYEEIVDGARTLLAEVEATGIGGAENYFFATSDDAAVFRVKAGHLRDLLARIRTGAQMNESENQLYETLVAQLGNLTRNNVAGLRTTMELMDRLRNREMDWKMVPQSQRDYIRMLGKATSMGFPTSTVNPPPEPIDPDMMEVP